MSLASFRCFYNQLYIFHTLFWCLFEQANINQEPVLWSFKSRRRHRTVVFLVNFVILILLLNLSMYLIAGFDISYFSRFQIKMNPNFIVYSFSENISMKWDAHPVTSSSNEDMFIKNFNANCNIKFFISFSIF